MLFSLFFFSLEFKQLPFSVFWPSFFLMLLTTLFTFWTYAAAAVKKMVKISLQKTVKLDEIGNKVVKKLQHLLVVGWTPVKTS